VSEGSNFAIACRVPPEQIVAQMRAILHSADPVLTIADVRTMKERMQASNARRTLQTALVTGFSAFALCLAVAGIYGLMSYLVRQRTREIGLRVALGSSKTSITRLIVGQALKLVLLGVAIGVCAALVITRLLTSWLFGVSATDTLTFVLVPLAILLVTCLGCILPASEATRVDPIDALRNE
jgi:ABC-type antimicrobial peptide transport system permease subunit